MPLISFFMKMFLLKARTAAVFQLMGPFDQVGEANYTPCWAGRPPLKLQYLGKYKS